MSKVEDASRCAFLFTNTSTTSADCPPIWKPKLPPLSPTNTGALQPLAVRQLATPKPNRPPTPSPACTTPGITAMQVASLSSDFGGERSGTDTSSARTSLARCARLLNLSSPLSCARAELVTSCDASARASTALTLRAAADAAMRQE